MGPRPSSSSIRNHLLDLLLLRFEAQCAHGHFQLLGVDLPGTVSVEQVKGLLDLLFLLLGELLLLLAPGVEAAQRHAFGAERPGGRLATAEWPWAAGGPCA